MKKILIFLIIIPFVLQSQTKSSTQNYKNESKNSRSNSQYFNNSAKHKGKISGKVKSINDNKALEFASVSLNLLENNNIIEGTITDERGRFVFDGIEIGKYKLIVSFIGYEKKIIEIETTKGKVNYKSNNILLKQTSKLLNEVSIEEQKNIYEAKIDKIVYNAENDLNDSENDATDVLRKAPLLSVDLEGNVSLRGSNNIKFLVNGKASTFFSSDVSTALQMIPADEIKSVEVITSPGAKYDGEGDAGIVNIITKRTIIDGYQASFSGAGGSKSIRGNFNLKIGKGKFGLSAKAGNFGSWPGRIGTHYYKRSDWDSIVNGIPYNPNILIQEGTSESFYQGYRGSIGAFYNPNTYNSFNSSFSLRGRTKPSLVKDSIIYTDGFHDSLSYINYYSSDKTDRTINLEWSTDYTKKFKENEEQELIIAFQLGGDINDRNTDINEANNIFLNENDERVIEQTLQVDYVHPFGKSSKIKTTSLGNQNKGFSKGGRKGRWEKNKSNSNKIEIGAKIINRDRKITYSDLKNNILERPKEQFDYNQIVAASYLSSEFNFKKGIGLKAGLRHELTQASGDWKTQPQRKFTTPYQDILPSLVVSKSFNPMKSIKLSYNQRITRPSVRQINTNNNRQDNRNITIGNPNLKPTLTEQFELGINSFGRILQGSCQIYFKSSTNIIETFLDSISEETSWSSYRNIGESRQLGTNLFGSVNLRKISLRVSFDIYNYSGKDPSLGYNNWTDPVLLYSYWISGNYNFRGNWKAETSAFYRSPNRTIQGSSTTWSMMSIGVKKIFKNKRGSIGLRIIEPFNKNKEFINELEGEFFSQYNNTTIPFRSFAISFKYTLGKLSFKDPKTRIKNTDIIKDNDNNF